MRPTTSWSDLPGQRVGVWGLGVEGRASIRKLATLGIDPVLVDDRAPAPEDTTDFDPATVVITDEGGLDALLTCDVVIKTPGKSRYGTDVGHIVAAGVTVVGGLGLWLEDADRDRVVVITGTKGKSTTTAIAGHLLSRLGSRVMCGGNIGLPPFDPAVANDVDWWVIEASSYQVTDLAVAPPVVAVTSLHPDHLTWHNDDPETYYRDKLSLCTLPGARVAVVNGDSDLLRDRAELLGPDVRWVCADDASGADSEWIDELGLLGEHNRRNALIAREVLRQLGAEGVDDDERLAAAAGGFEHLPSRLTPVDTIDGVLFVDDSLSTNVLPTLAAVDAFDDRPVAVIVGGADRGIDYGPLAAGLVGRAARTLVIVVESEAAPSIRAAFADVPIPLTAATDEAAAAQIGFDWARPAGVVLLSPAAPSFDRYQDYRARAAAFTTAVARLST